MVKAGRFYHRAGEFKGWAVIWWEKRVLFPPLAFPTVGERFTYWGASVT